MLAYTDICIEKAIYKCRVFGTRPIIFEINIRQQTIRLHYYDTWVTEKGRRALTRQISCNYVDTNNYSNSKRRKKTIVFTL